MEMAKIMAKGQLTIPKRIRDSLGLEPGDQVGVKTEGGKIIIEKNTTLALAQKLQDLLDTTPNASDAEILQGAYAAHWGETRLRALRQILDSTPTIPADTKVIETASHLYVQAQAAGLAIADKLHTADRWIAACAIAYDLPLFSTDYIFRDVPGLQLFTGSRMPDQSNMPVNAPLICENEKMVR